MSGDAEGLDTADGFLAKGKKSSNPAPVRSLQVLEGTALGWAARRVGGA